MSKTIMPSLFAGAIVALIFSTVPSRPVYADIRGGDGVVCVDIVATDKSQNILTANSWHSTCQRLVHINYCFRHISGDRTPDVKNYCGEHIGGFDIASGRDVSVNVPKDGEYYTTFIIGCSEPRRPTNVRWTGNVLEGTCE